MVNHSYAQSREPREFYHGSRTVLDTCRSIHGRESWNCASTDPFHRSYGRRLPSDASVSGHGSTCSSIAAHACFSGTLDNLCNVGVNTVFLCTGISIPQGLERQSTSEAAYPANSAAIPCKPIHLAGGWARTGDSVPPVRCLHSSSLLVDAMRDMRRCAEAWDSSLAPAMVVTERNDQSRD